MDRRLLLACLLGGAILLALPTRAAAQQEPLPGEVMGAPEPRPVDPLRPPPPPGEGEGERPSPGEGERPPPGEGERPPPGEGAHPPPPRPHGALLPPPYWRPPPPEGSAHGPLKRETDTSRQWIVRLVLLPITLGFLILAGALIWRARRTSGLRLAAALALLMGAASVWPVFASLTEQALLRDIRYRDGIDSIEMVASIQESLPRLSDMTLRYAFPEGATWMSGGPNWLGYLPAALISVFGGPVAGHNLGSGLHMALLALAAWALGRALGLGPILALLVGSGAVFAPKILLELDSCSLDRSTFYLVPLFFLCLHQATMKPGWRWPAIGGVALAAVFYGQSYYGLYLAAAAPLLVLPRLVSRDFPRRLARLALLGLVAGLVLAPGLIALDSVTRDTVLAAPEQTMLEAFADPLHPVDFDEVQENLRNYRGRPAMNSPRTRLLSTMAQSLTWDSIRSPEYLITGNSIYWPLALLALLLAKRRALCLIAIFDVAVLLIFSLGPFLKEEGAIIGTPLPYYAYMLLVPGFENLKNVERYLLLAATLSTIPLALGLQGLIQRLEAWRKISVPAWGRGVVVAVVTFLLCFLHLPYNEQAPDDIRPEDPPWVPPPRLTYPNPSVVPFKIPQALADLPSGQGAVVLPIVHPHSIPIRVATVQAGLLQVNGPSFGTMARTRIPLWYEDNAVLNRLCQVSGSNRTARDMPHDDLGPAMAELKAKELRYVVIFRQEMRKVRHRVEPAEAFLNEHLKKVKDDGDVAVWEIRDSGTKN